MLDTMDPGGTNTKHLEITTTDPTDIALLKVLFGTFPVSMVVSETLT